MSIQDDIFDLDDNWIELEEDNLHETWERFRDWAIEQENDAKELQVIVNRQSIAIEVLTEKLHYLQECLNEID